jgi:hypothetical protein
MKILPAIVYRLVNGFSTCKLVKKCTNFKKNNAERVKIKT